MKLSDIRLDADKIEAGAWVKNIPESAGLELKVRGVPNAAYRRMMSKLVDAIPRNKRRSGRIDPDEMEKVTAQCLAATVLLDWRGLENEDGSPLPYDKQTASKLLTEPEYRRFREAVLWAASQVGEEPADAGEAADAA